MLARRILAASIYAPADCAKTFGVRYQSAITATTTAVPSNPSPEQSTITEAIARDHRHLEAYFTQVINNGGNFDHQQRYGNEFIWKLARYAVAEELVVYPAFEKHVSSRDVLKLTESEHRDNHEIKELLKEFQSFRSSDAGYQAKLKALWQTVHEHIKTEEQNGLLALEAKLSETPGASEALAKSFDRTKMFAPSRSHPAIAKHTPFKTALELLMTPVDRLADMFRRFPD